MTVKLPSNLARGRLPGASSPVFDISLPSWRGKAACSGEDITRFMAGDVKHYSVLEESKREFCDRCPVITECLLARQRGDREYALMGGVLPRAQMKPTSESLLLRRGACVNGHVIAGEGDVWGKNCRKCEEKRRKGASEAAKAAHEENLRNPDYVPPEPPSEPRREACKHGHKYKELGYLWVQYATRSGGLRFSVKCNECARMATRRSRAAKIVE